MRRCLELAARGGRVSPNPAVGCVIVSDRGEVLAEGWHRGPGTAHGEADALAKLGGRADGATLYVNLEPCDHQGRTPPCAPAVIAAGVRRVVIGAMDPIPGHAGGARRIARAGIEVTRGVLRGECEELNRGFFTWAPAGRPWFTLKAAITLDGRIATASGESRWITGPDARAEVHRLRASHDAVLVGVGTVLADDPRLTVRLPDHEGIQPVRILVDSALRTPPAAAALAPGARRIIASLATAPAGRRERLAGTGAEILAIAPAPAGAVRSRVVAGTSTPGRRATHAGAGKGARVDLPALAAALGAAGITSVLVEGGGEIHAGFLAAGLVDEVVLHLAPAILGGRQGGPSWVGGAEVARLADAHRLTFRSAHFAGSDLVVTLRPAPASAGRRATPARRRGRG